MKEADLSTLEQVKQFVSGTESVTFGFANKDDWTCHEKVDTAQELVK